jgi:hypothetical protein
MEKTDVKAFVEMLEAALGYYGQTASREAIGIWTNGLREFTLAELRYAFSAHVKDTDRGRFAPKVADIIAHIPTGHPDPQEAWSLVAGALADERSTVVMTEQMRTAFFAAVDIAGDRIAARMTFLEVYKREIARARTEGSRPRWTVSLGFDKEGQEAPITEAVRLGRISESYAVSLLPHKAEALRLGVQKVQALA